MSTSVDIDNVTVDKTEEDDPLAAHIVLAPKGKSAAAVVMEAMVNGTPVTAVCGKVWVPSRNPESLPLCGKCKEVYELIRSSNDRPLPERPGI